MVVYYLPLLISCILEYKYNNVIHILKILFGYLFTVGYIIIISLIFYGSLNVSLRRKCVV